MTKKRYRNRFDVITDCNGNTDLIDKSNKFVALPLAFDLQKLSSEEVSQLREWIDFLNDKQRNIK